MVSPSELPQEILIDIFSRLPAKFVGQYRSLSKPWRDILSSRHFIKAHVNRKTHQQQSLLLIDKSHSFHSLATIKDGAVSRDLELPFGCTEIVGSCHGLVLLANEEDDKFLVNPVTLEKVIIPNSPLSVKDDGESSFSMHGFGYDSSIDDYKIVTLSCYNYSGSQEQWSCCGEMFVEVYSVKCSVWKRVESESFPCNHAFPEPHPGAFLNGAIHWLSRCTNPSYSSVLYAFDLCDEVFIEIPVPDDMRMERCFFYQVVVLGGCLCIIDVRYSCRTNVWIMKEYGLVESWTKLRIGTCGKWSVERPLCFVWDQEMMSVAEGRLLGVYNLKKGALRDVIVNGVLAFLEDAVTFVPSLVSPANVGSAPLSDDALVEASAANLALALNNHFLMVQHYRSIVSWDKAELNKLQAVICRLSRKCGESFLSSKRGKAYINKMAVEVSKASSKFQVDLYEDVVRGYRRWLRDSGHVDDDVIMLVCPDVPDSC